jgi:hypothetical protein
MKRDQILATFRSLAQSQGFYGRLLSQIESVDEETREDFLSDLESRNFSDPVDLIMWIEG